ncbi:MAG: serine dehydratase subunit alpha family protein [Clostridia bacterium]|nr:serine dehydratase subunit alpha family protein [Clostridia bacterium]
MSLPTHIHQTYTAILREELVPAMGCTEPIAIAYAASILRHALGSDPVTLRVELSGNIIKNVKSVIVPATDGMHGIEAAVAAGIVAGCPDRKLEVLCALKPADADRIRDFLHTTTPAVSELDTKHPFELVMTGTATMDGREITAQVHLMDRHTNVVSVERNGEDLTDRYLWGESMTPVEPADRSLLNVQDIITYAEEVDLDEVKPLLERQIAMNIAIAEEGLRSEYGASIGRLLYNGGHCDLRTKARAYAAAGSDARMNGCELPVCIISGSGNQGMTSSVPVVVYARAWNTDEETLLRALLVSNLITVHQKTGIGCLSAYCGAISAGCGCGCGICYLAGGRYSEIAHTLVNAVAILSGTICDGAKASCAAKIAMAVEAGIMGYDMMRSGRQFYGGDGSVTKGVENTIRNIGRLARDGMSETDREIIRIMLGE